MDSLLIISILESFKEGRVLDHMDMILIDRIKDKLLNDGDLDDCK